MRHPHPGATTFGFQIDVPIVNAGDGTHEHPTQALLDTFSLRQSVGDDLTGKNVAIVGDILHSRVACPTFGHFCCLVPMSESVGRTP